MNNFQTDFIPIPFMAIKNVHLTPASRLILGIIYYITEKRGEKFFMSNKYIADILGMSAGSINNSLFLLEEQGYILRVYNEEKTKRLEIKCLVRLEKRTSTDVGGTLDNVGGTSTDAQKEIPNKIQEEELRQLKENFDNLRLNYKLLNPKVKGLDTEWNHAKKKLDITPQLLEKMKLGAERMYDTLQNEVEEWKAEKQKGRNLADPRKFVVGFQVFINNNKWEEYLSDKEINA